MQVIKGAWSNATRLERDRNCWWSSWNWKVNISKLQGRSEDYNTRSILFPSSCCMPKVWFHCPHQLFKIFILSFLKSLMGQLNWWVYNYHHCCHKWRNKRKGCTARNQDSVYFNISKLEVEFSPTKGGWCRRQWEDRFIIFYLILCIKGNFVIS